MRRFGVTTIARWLSEELPPGITAYVENKGRLFELMKLVAMNGKIAPELRTPADSLGRFYPFDYVTLDTQVVLSMSENLAGVKMTAIAGQLVPAAAGSWALHGQVLAENAPTNRIIEESLNSSVFAAEIANA